MASVENQRPDGESSERSSTRWRSRVLSLLFVLLAGALLSGGSLLIASNAQTASVEQRSAPLTVQTDRLRIESHYQVPRRFIGQIEPNRKTDLGFESGGTVVELRVEEGDSVAEGELLASLDKRSLATRRDEQLSLRAAFQAQLELARLNRKRQSDLVRSEAGTEQQFDEARLQAEELEARIAHTDATIAGIDVALDKADIRAPFNGRVSMRHSDEGARVAAGVPVLSVLEQSEPRVRIGLSPDAATSMNFASDYVVEVQGRHFDATLERIRPDMDPMTRTVSAIFRLNTDDLELVPFGEVAEISLEQSIRANGAWVPLSGLTEGSHGLWNLLVIDETKGEPVVLRESVEVLYANERNAYVRGTFVDGVRFVDVGTHRVTVGLPVRIAQARQ